MDRKKTWTDLAHLQPVRVASGAHKMKTGMQLSVGSYFSRVQINGEIWWIKNTKLRSVTI